MAVEYTFASDSDMSPSQMAGILTERLPLQVRDAPAITAVGAGFECTTLVQSELGKALVSETFGITSGIKLVCRVDTFDLYEPGMDLLVDVCTLFLLTYSFDMLLMSNREQGIFLRKSGTITVDCADPYWVARWRVVFEDSGIPAQHALLPSL